MSRDAYYRFDEFHSQMNKDELKEKKFEYQCINNRLWSEILAYMAATPPVMMKNDDDKEYPYPEYLLMKLHELRDEIESNVILIARLEDRLDSMCEKNDYVCDDWK